MLKNIKEKKLDLLIFSILYISFLGAFIAYIIGYCIYGKSLILNNLMENNVYRNHEYYNLIEREYINDNELFIEIFQDNRVNIMKKMEETEAGFSIKKIDKLVIEELKILSKDKKNSCILDNKNNIDCKHNALSRSDNILADKELEKYINPRLINYKISNTNDVVLIIHDKRIALPSFKKNIELQELVNNFTLEDMFLNSQSMKIFYELINNKYCAYKKDIKNPKINRICNSLKEKITEHHYKYLKESIFKIIIFTVVILLSIFTLNKAIKSMNKIVLNESVNYGLVFLNIISIIFITVISIELISFIFNASEEFISIIKGTFISVIILIFTLLDFLKENIGVIRLKKIYLYVFMYKNKILLLNGNKIRLNKTTIINTETGEKENLSEFEFIEQFKSLKRIKIKNNFVNYINNNKVIITKKIENEDHKEDVGETIFENENIIISYKKQ